MLCWLTARLQEMVADLHEHGQRWVPILDPCIHAHSGYVPYDEGIAQDLFIKDITGKPYLGQARFMLGYL